MPPADQVADVGGEANVGGEADVPSWTSTRLGLRIRSDTQLLLAVAVALPVFAVEGISEGPSRPIGLLAPLVFIGAQLWLTTLRNAPAWLSTARLAICLAFIALANVWVAPSSTWPLSALAVPVVALAAASGGRGGTLVAVAGLALMLVPLALPGLDIAARQSVFAVAMAALALGYGSRRVVVNLERSSDRLRRANLRAHRRARELAAVESVGSLLARDGPTPGTLDLVMGVLEETFGYRYPSVYLWDGLMLRLGAQRNYRFPIETIAPDQGIVGRIVNARESVFLPDARLDPDFLSADPDVVSEIGIPLQSDGELFGVLNVETNGDRTLDEGDLGIMQIVADRLGAALALGRERQKLTERAALLDRLTTFATILGSSLDPATMDDEVAVGAATVIPADTVVLVNRDESGAYVINAVTGGDRSILGKSIKPGEGVSGEAMTSGGVVVADRIARAQFPKEVAGVALPDTLAAMAAPMVIGDEVVGVVTWLRGDLTQTFTAQEREVAALLAGKVGLALANARLHAKTQDAAITDPLTGLRNRRHFDAVLEREDAIRPCSGGEATAPLRDPVRPRPLRPGQQALRPPDRRPRAAPVRRHAPGTRPRERPRGSLRRRGVRGDPRERESRRRCSDRRGCPDRVCQAARRRRGRRAAPEHGVGRLRRRSRPGRWRPAS